MCTFAGNFNFFQGVMPLLNLEMLPKLNILLKQFVSATPLKLLNRICETLLLMYDSEGHTV